MSSRNLSGLVLTVLCLGSTLTGQAPSVAGEHPPTIRTTTREVLVDLVVRDKHHHPVTDLRPEEVAVYEDGVLQTVRVFRNVQGAEQLQAERSAAEKAESTDQSAGPATGLNSLRQVNFVSIVFAQIAPLNLDFARQSVREFLKSGTLPNTYVTIYRLNQNLKLIQPYTSDKDSLAKAADAAAKGLYSKDVDINASVVGSANQVLKADAANILATPGVNQATIDAVRNTLLNPLPAIAQNPLFAAGAASQDVSLTLGNALLAQSQLATGLRGSNLVYGMDALDSLRAIVRSQEKLPGRKVVLYLSDGLAFPASRRDAVDNLIGFANRSGVSFYTVDTRGLSAESPVLESLSVQQRAGAESSSQAADPRSGHREADDVVLATGASNNQLALRELAESTGGFAVDNTNEIATPMQRMMEDIRTHYELAYTPTSTVYDGHFRKIEVKVTRPKITVQTRKGYFALPELNGEQLQTFEAVALNAINARPAPAEFSYQMSVIQFRPKPETVEYEIAFEIPLSQLKFVANPKTHKSRMQASLVALIHNANGDIIGKVSRELAREVASADLAQLQNDRIFYVEPVELPGGHYVVDAAVSDEQAEKNSVKRLSVFVDSGKKLGLSSVEVVNRLEPLAGPRNPMNPFEVDRGRVVPTFDESAASGKPVGLYFVVYPSASAANEDPRVTLQVFRDGKEVARQPVDLPKAGEDGAIPVLLQFSPEPGQCDIRVIAEQGTLVAQSNLSINIK